MYTEKHVQNISEPILSTVYLKHLHKDNLRKNTPGTDPGFTVPAPKFTGIPHDSRHDNIDDARTHARRGVGSKINGLAHMSIINSF